MLQKGSPNSAAGEWASGDELKYRRQQQQPNFIQQEPITEPDPVSVLITFIIYGTGDNRQRQADMSFLLAEHDSDDCDDRAIISPHSSVPVSA